MHFQWGRSFMDTFYNEQWSLTLASLTALSTSLDLRDYGQVSDDGLRSLDCLAALTSLNLTRCRQVSDNGLRSLAGLTALTIVCLVYCLSHLVCDVYFYCGNKDF